MTISVIIPAYNSEKFIGQAINSALNQRLTPDEIIVVDDGSTDKTKEVVQSFGSKVHYYYQENAGAGKARNHGISRAKTEFIAFLDSDDFWDTAHLVTMIELLNVNPKSCMVYCGKKWVDAEGNPFNAIYTQNDFPSGWIFSDMFRANYISSSSVVVARKASLIEVGGFNENREMMNAQDYQLWLRMSAVYPVESSSQKTVNYRRHDFNRTLDVESRQRGLLYALETAHLLILEGRVCKENNPSLINVSDRMKQQYVSAIKTLYHRRRYTSTRELCLGAIKKGYWSLPILLRLVFTFMPGPLRK